MVYHHPRQTSPYQQGNVQGGQPQDSGYNNQRTSRSHSLQPSVQTGDHSTLNRSVSANRSQVSGQAQPFDAYGAGQNREPGLQYVPSPNTPQYSGAQGQIQSASYQDPSQAYQSAEQYFPLEGQPPHLVPQHVSQQNRTHQSPPQQPSVPHNPSHSVQGQYPQGQRGDVEYPAGHLQHRRSSSSQHPQQQQQQQPSSTQLYSQQPQSSSSQHPQQPSPQLYSQQPQTSLPQYQQQQQPSTQPYSQHQQTLPPQQGRQYQSSSQRYPQQQQQPSSQQYTQQQQSPPLRQQGNFATHPGNAASSFGANVPGEIYETTGQEIRQSRSTRRGTTHTGPICRLSNCRNPAIRDGATQELTEYCSLDHMQEDTRHGAPLCPACNKCPRRINGRYCGSSCEKYDKERMQQPHQQQQHYPRPPAGVRPTPSPSPGNVTWGSAPSESSPVGNFAPDNQHLSPVGGT
ncbi:hypothetical protein F5888DRAFT_390904 [Russula emetica]|nr:hypothetical protein F5888DRAFT_390904 [Russula emetica]